MLISSHVSSANCSDWNAVTLKEAMLKGVEVWPTRLIDVKRKRVNMLTGRYMWRINWAVVSNYQFPVIKCNYQFPVIKCNYQFPVIKCNYQFPFIKCNYQFPVINCNYQFPVMNCNWCSYLHMLAAQTATTGTQWLLKHQKF